MKIRIILTVFLDHDALKQKLTTEAEKPIKYLDIKQPATEQPVD